MSKTPAEDIKQKALKQIKEGRSFKDVALEFGYSQSSIRNWMNKGSTSKRRYTKRAQLITLDVPPALEPKKLVAFYGSPLDVCQAIETISRSAL